MGWHEYAVLKGYGRSDKEVDANPDGKELEGLWWVMNDSANQAKLQFKKEPGVEIIQYDSFHDYEAKKIDLDSYFVLHPDSKDLDDANIHMMTWADEKEYSKLNELLQKDPSFGGLKVPAACN